VLGYQVLPALLAPPRFVKHPERLSEARGIALKQSEPAPGGVTWCCIEPSRIGTGRISKIVARIRRFRLSFCNPDDDICPPIETA
jgi:hypothetical protein